MTNYLKLSTAVALVTLGFVVAAGGCKELGEDIDCHQMCEKLERCNDSKLDVSYCQDRCFDDAEKHAELRKRLDQCTDCLDENYSCAEVGDRCPVCKTVEEQVIGAAAAEAPDGAGGAGGAAGTPSTDGGGAPGGSGGAASGAGGIGGAG